MIRIRFLWFFLCLTFLLSSLFAHTPSCYSGMYGVKDPAFSLKASNNGVEVSFTSSDQSHDFSFDNLYFYLLIPPEVESLALNVNELSGFWVTEKNCIHSSYSIENEKIMPDLVPAYKREKLYEDSFRVHEIQSFRGYRIATICFRPRIYAKAPLSFYSNRFSLSVQWEDRLPPNKLQDVPASDGAVLRSMRHWLLNPDMLEGYAPAISKDLQPHDKSAVPDSAEWGVKCKAVKNGLLFFHGKDLIACQPPDLELEHFFASSPFGPVQWSVYPESERIHPDSIIVMKLPHNVSEAYLFHSMAGSPGQNAMPASLIEISGVLQSDERVWSKKPLYQYDMSSGKPYWQAARSYKSYPLSCPGSIADEVYKVTATLTSVNKLVEPEELKKNYRFSFTVSGKKYAEYAEVKPGPKKNTIEISCDQVKLSSKNNILYLNWVPKKGAKLPSNTFYVTQVDVSGKFLQLFNQNDNEASVIEDLPVMSFKNNQCKVSPAFMKRADNHSDWVALSVFQDYHIRLDQLRFTKPTQYAGVWSEYSKIKSFRPGVNFFFLDQYSPVDSFRVLTKLQEEDPVFDVLSDLSSQYSYLMVASWMQKDQALGAKGLKFFQDIGLDIKALPARGLFLFDLKTKQVYSQTAAPSESLIFPKSIFDIPLNESIADTFHFNQFQYIRPIVMPSVSPSSITPQSRKTLCIVPDELMDATCRYYSESGLDQDVQFVSFDRICDFYNEGVKSSDALFNYLHSLPFHSKFLPQNILLMGNANLDPQEYFRIPNWIPVAPTKGSVLTGRDFHYSFLDDKTYFYSVCRLPVYHEKDIQKYFAKLKTYQNTDFSGQSQRLVYAVDDFFETYSSQGCQFIPENFPVKPVYMRDHPLRINTKFGAATTRKHTMGSQELVRELNQGASMFYYNGHGGPTVLGHERLFIGLRRHDSFTHLLNKTDQFPFFVAYTCYAGKHFLNQPPFDAALSKILLMDQYKGVIAAYLPTEEGIPSDQRKLSQLINYTLFVQNEKNLGDFAWNLLISSRLNRLSPHLQKEYTLFGIPELNLKVNVQDLPDIKYDMQVANEQQTLVIPDSVTPVDSASVFPIKEKIELDASGNLIVEASKLQEIFPVQIKLDDRSYALLSAESQYPAFYDCDPDDSMNNVVWKDDQYFLRIHTGAFKWLQNLVGKGLSLSVKSNNGLQKSYFFRMKSEGIALLDMSEILKDFAGNKVTVQIESNHDNAKLVLGIPDISKDKVYVEETYCPMKDEIDKMQGAVLFDIWSWDNEILKYDLGAPSNYQLNLAPMKQIQSRFKIREKHVFSDEDQRILKSMKSFPFLDQVKVSLLDKPSSSISGDTLFLSWEIDNMSDQDFHDIRFQYSYYHEEEKRWKRVRSVGLMPGVTLYASSSDKRKIRMDLPPLTGEIQCRLILQYQSFSIVKHTFSISFDPYPDFSFDKKSVKASYDGKAILIEGQILSDRILPKSDLWVQYKVNDQYVYDKYVFDGQSMSFMKKIPCAPDNYDVSIRINPMSFIPEKTSGNNVFKQSVYFHVAESVNE